MLVVTVNVTVAVIVIVGAARLQWSVRAGSGNEKVTLIRGREIAGRRKYPNPFVEAGYTMQGGNYRQSCIEIHQ